MKQTLPIIEPCTHLRESHVYPRGYGCAITRAECEPIHAGPDLAKCPTFEKRQSAAADDSMPDLPCVHLGDPIRDADGMRATVECPDCPSQLGRPNKKELRACAVHGRCTSDGKADGVASCRGCKDKQAATESVELVVKTADGIGDHLCALAIANGLAQSIPTTLVAKPERVPWMELWDTPARISREPTGRAVVELIDPRANGMGAMPRWASWSKLTGAAPKLPKSRLPADALEWAAPWAGRVVIAPFAAHGDRTWRLDSWLEVERALIERGFYPIIIDDRQDRTAAFQSPKLIIEPPARVAAVVSYCDLFLGNDSGMAHLAGMLGRPAVAICSRVSDPRIFGMYPSVQELRAPALQGLDGITPTHVTDAAIANIRKNAPFGHERFHACLVEADRWRSDYWLPVYSALWHTVRAINPKRIVEIGTRAGYSSWTMLDACPEASIHAIEIDSDTHGGFKASYHNALAINPKGYTLQLADSHSINRLPECDLCYVDGDHTEEGCYLDLVLAERSGVPVMLVDDYTNLEEIRLAVRRFMNEHPHRRGEFIPSRTGLWLIR